MNMFKSNGGFTLVELIVVIAILAILAGIAVPAYSGYIKKAEQAADLQTLSTINTAAQGLAIAKSATITAIKVTAGPKIEVSAKDSAGTAVTILQTDITDLTGTLTFGKNFTEANWTPATATEAAKWAIK